MERMLVTLSLAAGPGFPLGCVDHRYEIELALDAAGQLLITEGGGNRLRSLFRSPN